MRPLLAFLVAALATGCARDFHAPDAPPMRSPWLNASVDWLSTGPATEVRVRLRVAARKSVRLRNALLTAGEQPPCVSDKTFVTLQADGFQVTRGPFPLEGTHELELLYDDHPRFLRLEEGAAIDLELEDDHGHGCVRVPLLGVPSAPKWKPVDTPRYAMGARLEAFPITIRDRGELSAVGGAGFWFGFETLHYRAYLEESAAFTANPTSSASGHLALTVGGSRELLEAGPLALSFGVGYQTDWYFAREPGTESGSLKHVLYGPTFAPSLALALEQGPHLPTARGGTLHLELTMPTVLWFGAPEAEGVTAVMGFTVGVFGVF